MLASYTGTIASIITGTIDEVRSEFYQEDIWQIISCMTADIRAEIKPLAKRDRTFANNMDKYQK